MRMWVRLKNIVLWCVLIAVLGIVYLRPVTCLLNSAARSLPRAVSSRPSPTPVVDLGQRPSAVLVRSRAFRRIDNEGFPQTVESSPFSGPGSSKLHPRLHTAVSREIATDWYENVLKWVYFLVLPARFAGSFFLIIPVLTYVQRRKSSSRRVVLWQAVAGIPLLLVAICLVYTYTIKNPLGKRYCCHRSLVWEDSYLDPYVMSENLALPDPDATPESDSPNHDLRREVCVVNARRSPIDLYVDGYLVDRVPARGIRYYYQLRFFSRLTTLEASSRAVVDDLLVREKGERRGILIYNAHALDRFSIVESPTYR